MCVALVYNRPLYRICGKSAVSQSPNVDFFSHHTPVGVVVIRADNVKAVDIVVYQVVQLSFPKHVIIPKMGKAAPVVVGVQRLLRAGRRQLALVDVAPSRNPSRFVFFFVFKGVSTAAALATTAPSGGVSRQTTEQLFFERDTLVDTRWVVNGRL